MKIKLDSRPLYQRAEEALLSLLETCAPGDQLPPEPLLAQSLGISRATLREALRNLERKHIISRRQGVGTFYRGPQALIDSGLEALVSVDALALRQGIACRTANLEIRAVAAGPKLATPLRLESGQAVTVVRRIKIGAGRPIAYLVDALPQSVATPEALREGLAGSVLEFLLTHPELSPTHAVASIVPLRAGKKLGRLLRVAPTTALLLLEETVYSGESRPVDYSRNYFVPGHFQLHLVRHRLA